MPERWFSEDELRELSRPTMDRAIEALDAGDVAGGTGPVRGDEARVADAPRPLRELGGRAAHLRQGPPRGGRGRRGPRGVDGARLAPAGRGDRPDRPAQARRAARGDLARALDVRRRRNPGAFSITEDDEKVTFSMNPCGSGQRLWRNGAYEGEHAYAVTDEAHDWSYGRKGFPIYCTHCSFMNELLPIRWLGFPIYPSHPPERLRPRPVRLALVQGPGRHPGRALGALRAPEAMRALVTGAARRDRARGRRPARASTARPSRRADVDDFDLRDPEADRRRRRRGGAAPRRPGRRRRQRRRRRHDPPLVGLPGRGLARRPRREPQRAVPRRAGGVAGPARVGEAREPPSSSSRRRRRSSGCPARSPTRRQRRASSGWRGRSPPSGGRSASASTSSCRG